MKAEVIILDSTNNKDEDDTNFLAFLLQEMLCVLLLQP